MTERLAILSPRLLRCLSLLADNTSFVTVTTLAETCKTSKRTLFRELKDINEILRPYHVSLLSKTGYGIKLEGEDDDRLRFKSLILQAGSRNATVLKDERQMYLLSELLKNKCLQKYVVYSRRFDVSEATISNDLKVIEGILESYDLHFDRKPGMAVSVIGSEEQFRKAITDYIHKHLDDDPVQLLSEPENPSNPIEDFFRNQGPDSILQLVNKEILWKVIQVLKENDSIWIHRLVQSSYIGLILHITIAIERIANNDEIKMNPVLFNQIKEDSYYKLAQDLANYLEEAFSMKFPMEEIGYITMHLKGARLLAMEAPSLKENDDELISAYEATRLVYRLVEEYEHLSGVQIKQDEMLIGGLTTHLRPALIRMKYNMEIRNPLLKQIQTQYAQVYQTTKQAVETINQAYGLPIYEGEIGFLAIHFGAAMERLSQKQERRTVRLAVVCASGIGISSLLASKIKRIFQSEVTVHPHSQLEIQQMTPDKYDLMVTTMPLDQGWLPILVVNPLLSEEDIEKLRTEIKRISQSALNIEHPTNDASLGDVLFQMNTVTSAIHHLLENLDVVVLDASIVKAKVISTIGYRIGKDKRSGKIIVNDLKAREAMGVVHLDEEQIILLHAKSSGVSAPTFMVFRSNANGFRDPAMTNMKSIVVLLIPQETHPILSEMMSKLSAGLIESPSFLTAIHTSDKTGLKLAVEALLKPSIETWLKAVVSK